MTGAILGDFWEEGAAERAFILPLGWSIEGGGAIDLAWAVVGATLMSLQAESQEDGCLLRLGGEGKGTAEMGTLMAACGGLATLSLGGAWIEATLGLGGTLVEATLVLEAEDKVEGVEGLVEALGDTKGGAVAWVESLIWEKACWRIC